MPPAPSRVPFLVTVHDLMHRVCCGRARRIYYDTVLRRLCTSAALIITVSEASRREIDKWLGGRVATAVSRIGVDTATFSPCAEPAPEDATPYILCIGNDRPHKNLPLAVRAFARARLPKDLTLVIAGTGATAPSTKAAVEASGLNARARLLGTVSDAALPGLYRGALALLFPSLYEGFGLPVLEAQACGTPVIASPCPSVEEAPARSALPIDPRSEESVAAALEAITASPRLRHTLSQAGLQRARDPSLTWDSVASLVWQWVERAPSAPNPPKDYSAGPSGRPS